MRIGKFWHIGSCIGAALAGQAVQAQISSSVPIPPDTMVKSPGGVDMRTGEYHDDTVDLSIGGMGGFSFTRVPEKNAVPISNWHYVIKKRGKITEGYYFTIENNAIGKTFFNFSGNGPYFQDVTTFADVMAKLELFGSGSSKYFVYTAGNGTATRFQATSDGANAYAEEIKHPSGLTYTFAYDTGGVSTGVAGSTTRLRRVASNTGYQLVLEYQASPNNDKISKVCAINFASVTPSVSTTCPAGVPTASYGYLGKRISSVTDAAGATRTVSSTYVNGSTPFQDSFYKPGESQPWLTNSYQLDNNGNMGLFVTLQTYAGGRTLNYWSPQVYGVDYPLVLSQLTGWTENGTNHTTMEWGIYQNDPNVHRPVSTPGPIKITDPLGRVTEIGYNGGSKPLTKKLPSGLIERYSYNGYAAITEIKTEPPVGSSLSPISVTYIYDCAAAVYCMKPASMTDGRGNQTDFTYDPTHGGVLTETLPADANGVRAQKRSAYIQRYAWVKDSGSGYVQAGAPIWLLSEMRTCRTTTTVGNACSGGAADEVVTTYDYGPDTGAVGNNLLLRGVAVTAEGQTLRTCYGYDVNGNRIWETKPRAGLAVCQ